jgi:hypothetical protein
MSLVRWFPLINDKIDYVNNDKLSDDLFTANGNGILGGGFTFKDNPYCNINLDKQNAY